MNEFDDANAYAIKGHINLLEFGIFEATIRPQNIYLDRIERTQPTKGLAICYRDWGSDNWFEIKELLGYKETRLYSTVSAATDAISDLLIEYPYLQKLNPDQVIGRKKEIEECLQITQNILNKTK